MMETTTQIASFRPAWSASRIAKLADWSASPLGPVVTWPPHLLWTARTALGASLPTMLLWGPQLVQIYNEAYRQAFMGDRHPAGMGQRTQECWPEVWHFNAPIYQRVLNHEAVFLEDQEYLLQGCSGPQAHFITLSYDPVHADNGQVEGILISLLDVTRRVKVERENKVLLDNAQETAKTLQAWFEQAPGFVAVLRGREHTFEMANMAYCQLVGHRDILGKPVREALPEVRGQRFDDLLDQVFRTGETYIGRGQPIAVQQALGGPRIELFLNFVYQPIVNKVGVVVGVFVQGHDVTEQHRALQALHEANRRKDEFLAMLAHELRNPLAPISSAAHLLALPAVNEAMVHKASAIINRQVRHMTELVDDLLDVSRVTRGLVDLHTETLELRQVVASAIEQVQPLIEARGHALVLRLGSTPAFVQGDKTRLVQVLCNLLNNAAKYTAQNGEIVLAFEVQGPQVCLTVSDNGSGMAPGLVPHVFELFTQAERTPDRAQGGLGLGLALVKHIVALHGGAVQAHSEGLGKGSVFTVTLPLIERQANTADGSRELHPASQGLRNSEFQYPLRCMIVDDNRDAGQVLASLLEATGHEVLVREDAESALVGVGTLGIEVFILDIGLPGIDGYALARQLRAKAETQGAVLVALTGYGQAHDRALSMAAGFDHFFVKPIHMHQLTELLAKVKA